MSLLSGKNISLSQDEAELLAIQALGFIASEEAYLAQFLQASGYEPEAIRNAAGSPAFLAGVLDFLLRDETLLLVFASHNSRAPEELAAAHRTLSGENRDYG